MRKTATMLLAVLTLLACAALAPAADKPDFSGDWKVDLEKSNFGPAPPPTSYTRKIDHNDPKLRVTDQQSGPMGDNNSTFNFTTDGKEATNEVRGMEAKSTASWDGDKLNITTKLDAAGTELKLTEKWSLSEDGKTLTSALHFTAPQGEFDITLVMNKQ